MVGTNVDRIIGSLDPCSVRVYLLHDYSDLKLNKPKKLLLLTLNLAAFLLFASSWKSKLMPSREHWWAKARYLVLMSKLTSIIKFRQGNDSEIAQFKQQWTSFFCYDCFGKQDYVQLEQLLSL